MNPAPTFGARIAAALATAVTAFGFTVTASTPPIPEADQQCLGCHGQAGLTKAFSKGDPLSLHVDPGAFAASVHAPLGCAACHAGIDMAKHPGSGSRTSFESARAYAVAGMQTCRQCHGPIFEAYAGSVHGTAGSDAAPICADCHGAHRVVRASVGKHLRDTCASCHAGVRETHAKWLPNTPRHLEAVACAACHAPGAGKRLELRLFDPSTRAEAAGEDLLVESAAKPVDGKAIEQLLEATNRGGPGRITLVGRLEARTAEETHGLSRRGDALRDCAVCHRKGADAFRNVSISIVGPDGKRVRYEAQSDVLHSPRSIDSMRHFYAPGGTRIQALDVLLGLAVGGGILAPLGHLVVRRLMRRKEKSP